MSEPTGVIFTALKEELNAVSAAIPDADRERVRIVRAGMGWDAATRATEELLRSTTPRWICFSGFCGGLVDAVEVGDVVVATRLTPPPLHQGEGEPERVVARELIDPLEIALKKARLRFHFGPIVCARAPVMRVEDKRELGRVSEALAVDMESYAIAKAAGDKCLVFTVRAVSDCVDDELPPEIGGFIDENGNVRMGRVTRFLLSGTSNGKILWRLKVRSEKAAASLTAAWKAAWPALRE